MIFEKSDALAAPTRVALARLSWIKAVCLFPGAIVSAHYATDIDEGFPREQATEAILNDLPKIIGDTLRPHIQKNFNRGSTLTADQLVKLGIKRCKGTDPLYRSDPRNSIMKD